MSHKYRLTFKDIDRTGGIARLDCDGFNRHEIHDIMYKETKGAKQSERTEIIEKLYNREEPC